VGITPNYKAGSESKLRIRAVYWDFHVSSTSWVVFFAKKAPRSRLFGGGQIAWSKFNRNSLLRHGLEEELTEM
jgi:hypothetical protein